MASEGYGLLVDLGGTGERVLPEHRYMGSARDEITGLVGHIHEMIVIPSQIDHAILAIGIIQIDRAIMILHHIGIEVIILRFRESAHLIPESDFSPQEWTDFDPDLHRGVMDNDGFCIRVDGEFCPNCFIIRDPSVGSPSFVPALSQLLDQSSIELGVPSCHDAFAEDRLLCDESENCLLYILHFIFEIDRTLLTFSFDEYILVKFLEFSDKNIGEFVLQQR